MTKRERAYTVLVGVSFVVLGVPLFAAAISENDLVGAALSLAVALLPGGLLLWAAITE